jgi:hypothetical protein
VPGNCTGLLQPQDVGLQRVAKHKLKQSMLEYLFRSYEEQIAARITPENVVFSSSYPVLRNALVRACVDLYAWLESADGEAVIKWVCLFVTFLSLLLSLNTSPGKNVSFRGNLSTIFPTIVSQAASPERPFANI